MSKINLWNTISLTTTGRVKLYDSGRQLFGTVVKHGVNDKTVTVRVSSKHFNKKYKKQLYSSKNKQVHDEYNYCVTGDRVIIENCDKVSSTKAYYVKTIVQPFLRPMTPKGDQILQEAPISTTGDLNKQTVIIQKQPIVKQSEITEVFDKRFGKDAKVVEEKSEKNLEKDQATQQKKDTKKQNSKDKKKAGQKEELKDKKDKKDKKDQKDKKQNKSQNKKDQKSLQKPKKKIINRRQKKADKLV